LLKLRKKEKEGRKEGGREGGRGKEEERKE
jgi:hypothetical protein